MPWTFSFNINCVTLTFHVTIKQRSEGRKNSVKILINAHALIIKPPSPIFDHKNECFSDDFFFKLAILIVESIHIYEGFQLP